MSSKNKTTNRRIVSSNLLDGEIQSGIFNEKMGTYIQKVKESEFSQREQAYPLSEYIVKQIAHLDCMRIILVVEKQGGENDIFLTDIWTLLDEARGSLRNSPRCHSWWYLPLKFWEKIELGADK